jgi:NAD(P)H-flavin reductase
LLHTCRDGHYLKEPLQALAQTHDNLQLEWIGADGRDRMLDTLRPTSRRDVALVCGSPSFVEACARRLYLAGLPRGQIFGDAFIRQMPAFLLLRWSDY